MPEETVLIQPVPLVHDESRLFWRPQSISDPHRGRRECDQGDAPGQIRSFRDIRPKAASGIEDRDRASRLLGDTDKRITGTVYKRAGEIVAPTK